MAEKPEALTVGVLHGPNLDRLGQREPEIYGTTSLAEVDRHLEEFASQLDVEIRSFQSNVEGELISWIQDAAESCDGLLVNAAAYTHTSVAIRDALLASNLPFVEVHITNIFAREPFRQHSYLSDIALGLITGFGPASYLLALRGLVAYLRQA